MGKKKVIVIGAGIGGLSTAVTLGRVGIDVEVHERAPELLAAGSGLSVMSNAISALDTLDIDLGLEKRGQVIESYTIREARGGVVRELPFPDVCRRIGTPSVCISRSDLQQAPLDAAGDVPIHLGHTVTGFEHGADGVRVSFEDGGHAEGDILVGADGFRSTIRGRLAGIDDARDSGYVCWLGIVPFEHERFPTGCVGHYWGSGQRFGLIDIGRGRAYWWGTKNMPAEESADWRGGKAAVLAAYDGWADEVRAVIEATPEADILAVPSRDRPFLERWGTGPVTLLGDAAHPMLTSLGQGAAMAIEDAVVLATTLAERADSVDALRTYEDRRRERTRQMVATSRSVSEFEQLENPLRRAMRDTYFRFVPRKVLEGQSELALTFPRVEPAMRGN